jgi:ABC-type transport system involved in multi-copper enzyme maturation permease subunit
MSVADSRFFDYLTASVESIEASTLEHDDDYTPVLLAASERVYDAEEARRDSFIARSGFVLGAGGILGALVVAASQLGLMHKKSGPFGIAAWIVLILFIVSLLYLGASLVIALGVQGVARIAALAAINPSDLAPRSIEEMNARNYNVQLAKLHLAYAIENYRSSSKMALRLYASQVCLRNGVIFLILTGMLSPLALNA